MIQSAAFHILGIAAADDDCVLINLLYLFQGLKLEPSLMRCCHIPCGSRPIDHAVNISNKLLLDIRRHIKKYYSVSIPIKLCFTHTHIHVLLYHLWGCTMVTGTAGQLFFSPLLYFVFFTHASFYQKYKLNVNLWCTNVKLYALFNYCGCVACQHFAKEFKLLLQLTKYKLKWTETELHVMKHSKCVKKKERN